MLRDLQARTIRGELARLCVKGSVVLEISSLEVLASLLHAKDFGLVGMAFTGVLMSFRDFRLSVATVQRNAVSHEQVSTLFRSNVLQCWD
jgi:hypothetical protein